jgi:IS30 family transposase
MPKGKVLTEREKGQIEAFHQEKVGIREIARRIGRSHQVVMNFLANPKGYGKTKRKPRKSKLSDRDRREIVRMASNTSKSLAQIKQNLKLDVSRETIRQVLVKSPYIKRAKKMRAPNLTPSHIEKRLVFAKTNMNRQWDLVSF